MRHVGHILHGWRLSRNGHADHSWLQVGGLRHLRYTLLENRVLRGVNLGLSDLLLVLAPNLVLVMLDIDPSHPLRSGMLRNCFGESDCEVIDWLIRFIGRPDRIETPAAATLYCHTGHEAIEERDEGTLVADHGEHEACNDVVMEMQLVALRPKTFRVPVGEAKNSSDEYLVLTKAS